MIVPLVRFTFVAALAVACLLAGDIRRADAQLLRQTIEELSVEPPDPAVEQWVQRAQRGPAELGRAISALTRMGEFEKVNELAARLGSLGYKAPQKVMVAEQIDPAERLRIVSHPDVSPEAITAIDDVFNLRQESLASPKRIAKAIEALTSSNVDQSLPAIRVLFEGGEASTAALVHAIVTERDSDKRDSLLRAMIRIDEASGVEALQRISLYGTDATRAGALSALVRLAGRDLAGNESVLTELVTALYRQDDASDGGEGVSASARIASDALASTGVAIPLRTSVIEELNSRLEAADQRANRSLRNFGRVTAWVINEQRTGVSPQRIPQWVLEFRNAADAAARLVAVGDNDATSVVRQLNSILAYNVANNPDWGSSDQVAAFRSNELLPAVGVIQSSEIDFLLSAIDLAKETQNEPALIGWLRMIQPAENVSPAPWFVATGRHVSSLVETVDHPNAIVRYEAAAAIARLRPTDAYAGSARVRQRWRQMSLLTDRPTAIVLENRPEVITELETLINQAGLEPRFATSVRQAEIFASLGEDLRLIISKREPFDASAVELIDRVRRINAARDTPLVIYRDPPPRVAEEAPEEEEDLSGLNEVELQKLADEAAVTPDRFGVIGGIENIKGIVHRELLYGDLDADHTTRLPLNLEWVGEERWGDESLRAGLIRDIERPRSVAGLYELLLASRRHLHLPPLSPVDRARFRDIAAEALADIDR
ncbi:hypothetical protein [Rhodopirellula sallentina]|uniref:Putative secreted protein n=1 Tax=Rhodopirellula sallentina SM41 TaxID=1263870 RepID=M5U1S9_9BACT|nr:hypothetical protein [Rhodopirellula sallentina]EMI51806.1 putative secreted protein [Rhodopirellula sallentina SM41]